VLSRLWHRAVHGREQQHGDFHLSRSGDHVLHIIGVPGAVDVDVVSRGSFVLEVRSHDRHGLGFVTTRTAFGDGVVVARAVPEADRVWIFLTLDALMTDPAAEVRGRAQGRSSTFAGGTSPIRREGWLRTANQSGKHSLSQ